MLKVANSVISASRITGVLPVVNGGTGVTTSTGTGNTVLSAAPTLSGDVNLSTGNLVIGTAGKGIDFSITSSGSGTMTSELLADYEEGTFTPTYYGVSTAGTTTFTAQTGRYTKVGNRVDFALSVAWSAATGTGSGQIGGLPFSAANLYSSASILTYNFTYPVLSIPVPRVGYGTTIDLLSITTGGSGGGSTVAITGSGEINISGTYFI